MQKSNGGQKDGNMDRTMQPTEPLDLDEEELTMGTEEIDVDTNEVSTNNQ